MCNLCNGSGFVQGKPVTENYGELVDYETVRPCDCMVRRIFDNITSVPKPKQTKQPWWEKK